jgi:hypothetical protein
MPDEADADWQRGICRAEHSHFTPPGWHSVTPRIVAHEAQQLVAFVKRAFGATGDYRADMPTILTIGYSIVMTTTGAVRR